MKRSVRLPEPESLTTYRTANPDARWDEMRNDGLNLGPTTYTEIKVTLIRGQRCLCAYCEMQVAVGTGDQEILDNRTLQRVEHFHEKEDEVNRPPNWDLMWENLLAVCMGGSVNPPAGEPVDPRQTLEPIKDNLSCDAHKTRQVTENLIGVDPSGEIAAPGELPHSPLLFKYTNKGEIEADAESCDEVAFPANNHASSYELMDRTIVHLNLNCSRLVRLRMIARNQLEKRIQSARRDAPAMQPNQVLLGLARRLFPSDPSEPWPEFFTLIRWRLGDAAEEHLQQIGFEG